MGLLGLPRSNFCCEHLVIGVRPVADAWRERVHDRQPVRVWRWLLGYLGQRQQPLDREWYPVPAMGGKHLAPYSVVHGAREPHSISVRYARGGWSRLRTQPGLGGEPYRLAGCCRRSMATRHKRERHLDPSMDR